jgi:hypothetical protein
VTGVVMLWTLGPACLIVALLGKAVTIGSVQLPSAAEKPARPGLAIVGSLALIFGLMIFLGPQLAGAAYGPPITPRPRPYSPHASANASTSSGTSAPATTVYRDVRLRIPPLSGYYATIDLASEKVVVDGSSSEDDLDFIPSNNPPFGAHGILGVRPTIGFALLPSSTLAEKAWILLASLALSVASVSGIGAWRSGPRFAVTAGSAGLALIFTATLSVAVQHASAVQAPLSAPAPSRPPAATRPAAAVSSRPAPTLSPSASPASGTPLTGQPLVDMTAVDASSTNYQSGPQQVDSHSYQQTLYDSWDDYTCDGSYAPSQTTYELNYKYRDFRAVVGLADSSPSGETMQFSVLVDGQQKGISPTLGVGQTLSINIPVTGAFRITLQTSCTSAQNASGANVTAVWVNPVVIP